MSVKRYARVICHDKFHVLNCYVENCKKKSWANKNHKNIQLQNVYKHEEELEKK